MPGSSGKRLIPIERIKTDQNGSFPVLSYPYDILTQRGLLIICTGNDALALQFSLLRSFLFFSTHGGTTVRSFNVHSLRRSKTKRLFRIVGHSDVALQYPIKILLFRSVSHCYLSDSIGSPSFCTCVFCTVRIGCSQAGVMRVRCCHSCL